MYCNDAKAVHGAAMERILEEGLFVVVRRTRHVVVVGRQQVCEQEVSIRLQHKQTRDVTFDARCNNRASGSTVIYLQCVDVESFAHDENGVVETSPLVEDVGEVDQRHVTIFVRCEVERTTDALHSMVTVAHDAPVQACQVVEHPARSDLLLEGGQDSLSHLLNSQVLRFDVTQEDLEYSLL